MDRRRDERGVAGLSAERCHVADVVNRHLALVAVEGAVDEVTATLASGFRLHVEDCSTDRHGYLALIAARWAAEGDRPPLEVGQRAVSDRSAIVVLGERTAAYVRVEDALIAEIRMTNEWRRWADWVEAGFID